MESAPTSHASIWADVQIPIQHSLKKTPSRRTGDIKALAARADVFSLSCGNLYVLNPVGFVCLHCNLESETGQVGIGARTKSLQPSLQEGNRAHPELAKLTLQLVDNSDTSDLVPQVALGTASNVWGSGHVQT